MQKNIKAFIFDIGGVVTFTDFHALYKNFGERLGISAEFIEQYHKDNWQELILGNIGLKQFFQAMQNAGARKDLHLESVWVEEMEKVRTVNTELLEYIITLRKIYTIGVLTNLTESRLIVDEKMGIYAYFDFAILSCKEHLKKPNPAFYAIALAKAGVEANEVIFIDDMERNTIIAKELGLIDIVYKDNPQFFRELGKLKII